MLLFLVAIAKPGFEALDPRLVSMTEDVRSLQPPDVAAHTTWASKDGRVRVAAWFDEGEETRVRSSANVLALIAGDPLVVDRLPNGAADLADALVRSDRTSVLPSLEGIYALVRFDHAGRGHVVNDHLGIHQVFVGETPTATLISDNAGLIASAIAAETGKQPEPDLAALAMVAAFEVVIGDSTGYDGISTIPFGTAVSIGADGVVAMPQMWQEPWAVDRMHGQLPTEAIDQVEDRMLRIVRAVLEQEPGTPLAELTGGVDSRLVLALIHRAGLAGEVQFFTYGTGAELDTITAAAIADRLGLRYGRAAWPSPQQGFRRFFVDHIRRTAGQCSCYEVLEDTDPIAVSFSGFIGETLRQVYPAIAGLQSTGVLAERWARYIRSHAGHLRTPALEGAVDQMLEAMLAPAAAGYATDDLAHIFFIKHRIRRNIGWRLLSHDDHVYPLYATTAARTAFLLGPEGRASNDLIRALMRRADLGLDDIPYTHETQTVARLTWEARLAVVRPDVARHPVINLSRGRRALASPPADSWAAARPGAIRALVAECADSAGWAIVDRTRFMAELDRYDDLTRVEVLRLHKTLVPVVFAAQRGG